VLYDFPLQEGIAMAGPARRKNMPLSVPVSPETRARIARYARRTGVPVATGFRALAIAHLDELEEEGRLSRAQEWQRARSWAVAQTIIDGTAREGSLDELVADRSAAVRRRVRAAPPR
jgi:predicted DNA-binding protein